MLNIFLFGEKNIMWKKPLGIVGLLGVLLIIAGLILSPSFVGNFTSGGKLESLLRMTQVQLAQIYMIIFGCILLAGSFVINFLPSERRTSQFLIAICLTGIVLTISGLILSPAFVQKNFSAQNFLNELTLNFLSNFQIGVITIGCVVIFISLFVYGKKFLKNSKRFKLVLSLVVLLLYLALLYVTYINEKFPNNIILKSSEFSKVIDLLLGKEIVLSDFEPRPSLIVDRKQILKSKYPVIDIHFHLASDFRTELDKKALAPEALIKSMDSVGVKTIVNLDGIDINKDILIYSQKYPGRIINFAYPPLNSSELINDETLANLPNVVKDFVGRGILGIGELAKYLGLTIKDVSGKVIRIDDPRLDPFWAKIGELNIPVLWHVADPTPFFQPIDRFNERVAELRRYPFWSYYKPGIPSKETVLKQLENVLKKHPETIFIGAHMGQVADNLKYLSYLFDTYPNYYVDCAATFSELGRQPFSARKFFIKYQDRILFGSDGGALHGVKGWTVEKFYRSCFEFLETENEYIDYPMQGAINQGNWKIYGINLPDEVLEKVYYKNAEKILLLNKHDVVKRK
jgi:predicted TIM-barrel fold metal-dependent hydrolase